MKCGVKLQALILPNSVYVLFLSPLHILGCQCRETYCFPVRLLNLLSSPATQAKILENDFCLPKIVSIPGGFLFLLFLFLHGLSSCFFKPESFLGTDSPFWNWLGLTRKWNLKSCIKSCFYFACEALITQAPTS